MPRGVFNSAKTARDHVFDYLSPGRKAISRRISPAVNPDWEWCSSNDTHKSHLSQGYYGLLHDVASTSLNPSYVASWFSDRYFDKRLAISSGESKPTWLCMGVMSLAIFCPLRRRAIPNLHRTKS
ncbi:hypothetical protein BIW11_11368 [Tropilaelaps mercedesae]|uniref:Uncharacterized protein n=1 Tax=Tropilaelaps mercedesae TaxID=418985 RepID=A0A1V9XBD5_9ACAR|nr:hypothetical protein BIW11_11368 [Tropilaelaps mercedesae]